jgi:hypothetical protein
MSGSDPRTRYLGYGGLGLLLLAVVLFGVATTESRYENVVHRTKGVVLAKEIRSVDRGRPHHVVTYRVVVGGRTLEREGGVGSRGVWDSIRVGDELDVEAVGDTVVEIRLAMERVAGSRVYYGLAAASLVGGIVLLGLRLRG